MLCLCLAWVLYASLFLLVCSSFGFPGHVVYARGNKEVIHPIRS